MRIATWNINGIRARTDYIVHWLRARQPDMVGLQELKITDELFPADIFEAEGYHVLTHGQKAWNGVAVLSKEPAEVVHRGLPGQDEFGSRLITVEQDDLQFTTVYCPNGKTVEHADYPRKLAWFDSLYEYMETAVSNSEQSVLCGDFNICPESIDSWDDTAHTGQIFHTDAERERMQKLYELGLHDVYRKHFPETQAFSWWDYRAGGFQRNHGLRIDFILATESAAARVGQVEIDRDYRKKKDGLTASDHAPVIADLD